MTGCPCELTGATKTTCVFVVLAGVLVVVVAGAVVVVVGGVEVLAQAVQTSAKTKANSNKPGDGRCLTAHPVLSVLG